MRYLAQKYCPIWPGFVWCLGISGSQMCPAVSSAVKAVCSFSKIEIAHFYGNTGGFIKYE